MGVPVIVLGELMAGFEQGRQTARNVAELEEFLASVEVLAVDRETAVIFGRLIADLRRRGRALPLHLWRADDFPLDNVAIPVETMLRRHENVRVRATRVLRAELRFHIAAAV